MKTPLLITLALLAANIPSRAALPTDEAGAIAYLKEKGVTLTLDGDGHATRLMSSGKEGLTPAEYALFGRLTHLEQAGINGAPLRGNEWGFLKSLTRLRQLSIWHGHAFSSLEPFCGLTVESLTIGGCMGLRDLNKDHPDRLRNAILTLRDLPRLKKGNWYHSPLIPDDAHLAHIAAEFPAREELRLDFASPRGSGTNITPEGLAALKKLPLKVLGLENAGTFTIAHFQTLADIETLTTLLIDARRTPVSTDAVAALSAARPDVEVIIADEHAKGPPQPKRQ